MYCLTLAFLLNVSVILYDLWRFFLWLRIELSKWGAKDRLTSSWCTLGNVHFERQSSLSNKTAMKNATKETIENIRSIFLLSIFSNRRLHVYYKITMAPSARQRNQLNGKKEVKKLSNKKSSAYVRYNCSVVLIWYRWFLQCIIILQSNRGFLFSF